MTDVEKRTIDDLVSLGFEKAIAKIMVRFCGLPCPLTDNARNNADLLCRYLKPESIPADSADRTAQFLKRDNSKNLFMESIPDRYEFSGSQRKSYFANPLEWHMACDLKESLDSALRPILPREQQRMDMYREMYCKGAWQECDVIIDICKALSSMAPDQNSLEKTVSDWWETLFSYYSGTIQYIKTLKRMFVSDHIWQVFCDDIMNVREFTEAFKLSDRRETITERLKEKFGQYLIDLR